MKHPVSGRGLFKDRIMRQSMYIVDDFYNNPDEVRAHALTKHYFKAGHGNYPGLRTDPVEAVEREYLRQFIQHNILGQEITYFPDEANTAFQYTTENDRSWIHHDATTWAGVLYLTPDAPPETGTAIFRHRESKVSWWNPEDESTEYNFTEGLANPMDNDLWEPITQVSNVYNRLVIYRGNLYHSSMKPGFGDCKENGRLFQTFFFNTAGGMS